MSFTDFEIKTAQKFILWTTPNGFYSLLERTVNDVRQLQSTLRALTEVRGRFPQALSPELVQHVWDVMGNNENVEEIVNKPRKVDLSKQLEYNFQDTVF